VIDTNVMTTANRANAAASESCIAASARALQAVMAGGHVFIDHGGRIVAEYRQNLRARGEPGPGDAFLKWLLTHEWSGKKVTRVTITPTDTTNDDEGFEELPPPRTKRVRYDPSDRKFLAVAASHADHPPILQSFDSKWWGWTTSLAEAGVTIHFLCADDIAKKHKKKMQ
jgi:hypothetical protein